MVTSPGIRGIFIGLRYNVGYEFKNWNCWFGECGEEHAF